MLREKEKNIHQKSSFGALSAMAARWCIVVVVMTASGVAVVEGVVVVEVESMACFDEVTWQVVVSVVSVVVYK